MHAYEYLSPRPAARLVSPWNDIVIRNGRVIDPHSLASDAVSVMGSASGVHRGRLMLSDDSKTLVFKPAEPFALGEKVTVTVADRLRGVHGGTLPPLSFAFTVSPVDPARQESPTVSNALEDPSVSLAVQPSALVPLESLSSLWGLPPSYPVITVTAWNDPDPGCVFIAPYDYHHGGHLVILDDRAEPVFYRRLPSLATDFKLQPNGLITYFSRDAYFGLDSTYTVVDSWQTGNGYTTDSHGMQLLPNGHALLMSYDPEPVGMDSVVKGGDPDAIVTGLIIQELDAAKNVIFQWRSWDHFQITDAVSAINLTATLVDYVHGNSIDVDLDGSLLLSSRHLCEVTKINRQTGDIIWRLGLNAKNNEFSFVNDARGFTFQHDVRRLSNGHLTVFDNGNLQDPQYSRAVEYDLDEVNRIATETWEYRQSPDIFAPSLGNVQRLAGGGTMIGWGGTTGNPKVTELHADGSIAIALDLDSRYYTYRAFHSSWRSTAIVTSPDSLEFGAVAVGDTALLPLVLQTHSTSDVTITCIASSDSAFSVSTPLPIVLTRGVSDTIDVRFVPNEMGEFQGKLYVTSLGDTELIAQDVALSGVSGLVSVSDPVGAAGGPQLEAERPNPFSRSTMIRYELPRPSNVTLEIFDVRGRKVDTLVAGLRSAGRHEITWAPRGLACGVYFCRMQTEGRVLTHKLVRMR